MPDINIGQMGHTTASGGKPPLRSMPKLTKINGDDNMSLIYRNMGNNHAYPFIWAETVTFSGSGTITLVSGVKFHGMKAADYCKVAVGALTTGMSAYVTKDSVANTITITSSAAGSVDVIVMVGLDPNVAEISCRGNTGAQQNLP
jgi:hypothetical protein